MELQGKRAAVLVEQMYQEMEVWYPVYRLREAGAKVTLVGPEAGQNYRSEEHTSELQSPCNLVCRLLLEKKKNLPESITVTFHRLVHRSRRVPVQAVST